MTSTIIPERNYENLNIETSTHASDESFDDSFIVAQFQNLGEPEQTVEQVHFSNE